MSDSEPLEGIECCCHHFLLEQTIAPYYQTDLIGHLNNLYLCAKLGLIVCKIVKNNLIFFKSTAKYFF